MSGPEQSTETIEGHGPLLDRAAIVQLTVDYCWALDSRAWEDLRNVFAHDAVTQLGAGGQTGVDEIIDRVSTALDMLDGSQHVVTTHQIDIDGDQATGRCYLVAQHIRHDVFGGSLFTVGGRYEDRYRRSDAGWRISERRLVVMWTEGNRRVVGLDP